MFAVINFKENQIKVTEGMEIKTPLFDCKEGDKVVFDQVMLIAGDSIEVGQPNVEGATVNATVTAVGQSPKINVIKFHSKKRYQKIGSHRQDFVVVRIDKIKSK